MKFYIPIDFYSRYSFRSRGHLMLENMDSSHGFVTNIEEVINGEITGEYYQARIEYQY